MIELHVAHHVCIIASRGVLAGKVLQRVWFRDTHITVQRFPLIQSLPGLQYIPPFFSDAGSLYSIFGEPIDFARLRSFGTTEYFDQYDMNACSSPQSIALESER